MGGTGQNRFSALPKGVTCSDSNRAAIRGLNGIFSGELSEEKERFLLGKVRSSQGKRFCRVPCRQTSPARHCDQGGFLMLQAGRAQAAGHSAVARAEVVQALSRATKQLTNPFGRISDRNRPSATQATFFAQDYATRASPGHGLTPAVFALLTVRVSLILTTLCSLRS